MSKKNCLYCGNEFEPKSPNAKYCSDLHRNYHFRQQNPEYRKRKGMAGIADEPPGNQQSLKLSTPSLPVEKLHKITQSLDPATQMVFDLLREQNSELRNELKAKVKEHADEIKALNAKIESLSIDKRELEKSRDDLQRSVDAKPSGLAGLALTQPDLMKEALPILAGLADKIFKQPEPVPPFVVWLKSQDENFQKEFMGMVSLVMQDKTRLEQINRSLMTASSPQQQSIAGAGRYS